MNRVSVLAISTGRHGRTECDPLNTEYRIPNTEYRIPNTEYRILNTLFILALLVCPAARAADKSRTDRWRNFSKESHGGLAGNEIQFIKQDVDRKIWIGTLNGLSEYRRGSFIIRLKQGQVWDVLRIGRNSYLIGTNRGITKLEGGKATESLKGYTVAPILRRDKKTVWALCKQAGSEQNFIMEWQGAGWKVVEALKNERVTDMVKAADGTFWISIDGNGVLAIGPGKDPAKAVRHLPGNQITALFADRQKRLWCGLWGRGVMVYDKGKWTRHIKKEKAAIFSLAEDSKGGIWVATNANGVWQFNGKKWRNHLKEEGSVNMLAASSDGKVWISTQFTGGLRCWNGKKWATSMPGPLPIRCLLEAADKSLLAGGVLDGIHVKKK